MIKFLSLFIFFVSNTALACIDDAKDEKTNFTNCLSIAKNGEPIAQYYIATLYYQGTQAVQQDYKKAVYWFQKAADQKVVSALYTLGDMYREGKGLKLDDKQALILFHQAIVEGEKLENHSPENKPTVAKIRSQYDKNVLIWFKNAETEGQMFAEYSVGVGYVDGKGVKQDDKLAFTWFLKAANHGYVLGQHNVGLMYHKGQGIQQDYVQAYKWYNISGLKNNEGVLGSDIIAKKMTSNQIKKAQELVVAWKKSHRN